MSELNSVLGEIYELALENANIHYTQILGPNEIPKPRTVQEAFRAMHELIEELGRSRRSYNQLRNMIEKRAPEWLEPVYPTQP